MLKNVASQKVSAQLVALSGGGPVTTGTTTVYVTVDAGTQATTTTATHKGNGEWSYAPTQAQTNGDHVAYTFVNSLAVNVTVQVYPVTYDTSVDTALTTIDDFLDTEIAAIKAKTDNLPASPANETTLTTIAGYLDTEVAAIKAKTDLLVLADIAAEVWDTAPTGTPTADIAEATAALVRREIIEFTVVSSPSPTTTTLTATVDTVPTVADQFKGRIVIFNKDTTTSDLRVQATDITASTAPGSGKAGLTFTGLTTAPAAGDTGVIV